MGRLFRILVLLLLPAALAGCSPAHHSGAAPAPAAARWMGALDGRLLLSELTIPGTHDSCALREPFPGTARCQTLGLAAQLEAGVRFLDIRCRRVGERFLIYHGAVSQETDFDGVLAACAEFLRRNPSECIIMSVKEERGPSGAARSFEEIFDTYAGRNPTLWHLETEIPPLEKARGRIVLLRRFAAAVPKGIDASSWRDNAAFDAGDAAARLRVQDKYRVADGLAKWRAVSGFLEETRSGPAGVLHLNFASGHRSRWFGVPDIPAVSGAVNPKLCDFFAARPKGRFGVVILDFADLETVSLILAANPGKRG